MAPWHAQRDEKGLGMLLGAEIRSEKGRKAVEPPQNQFDLPDFNDDLPLSRD